MPEPKHNRCVAMLVYLTIVTILSCQANTITYGGYVNLMKRQLLLSRNFISKHVRSGPMSAVTAILALLTIYYAIIGYFSPEFSYFELELQEDKESSSTLKWLKNSHGR